LHHHLNIRIVRSCAKLLNYMGLIVNSLWLQAKNSHDTSRFKILLSDEKLTNQNMDVKESFTVCSKEVVV
jgi:hypothetical protein